MKAVRGVPLNLCEVPISISGPDLGDGRLVHTLRAVGAVTTRLAGLVPGDIVGVRGPFGSEWSVHDGCGGDLVFVGGGIGLAPLRPAILEAIEHRAKFGDVAVLIGARTPDDLLFGEEPLGWSSTLQVDVTVDRAPASWRGNVGLVTSLLRRVAFDPETTTAFLCGPEVMMRVTADSLRAIGVRPASIKLSLERNMRCGAGLCGHCQLGPLFVCANGPVVDLVTAEPLMAVKEL